LAADPPGLFLIEDGVSVSGLIGPLGTTTMSSMTSPKTTMRVPGTQLPFVSEDQAFAISAATRTLLRARSRLTSRLRPSDAPTM